MHFNKVGKNLKESKRFKIKSYLASKMSVVVVLLNKYGNKILDEI